MADYVSSVDANQFRRRRFARFLSILERIKPKGGPIRVLDIGGVQGYWNGLNDLWRALSLDITIVNITGAPEDNPPFHIRVGNACNLAEYEDASFDVVHSNSVIE